MERKLDMIQNINGWRNILGALNTCFLAFYFSFFVTVQHSRLV